jgi:hypothetical protein
MQPVAPMWLISGNATPLARARSRSPRRPAVHPRLKNEPRAELPALPWSSSTAQKFTDLIHDDICWRVSTAAAAELINVSWYESVEQPVKFLSDCCMDL